MIPVEDKIHVARLPNGSWVVVHPRSPPFIVRFSESQQRLVMEEVKADLKADDFIIDLPQIDFTSP